MVIENIHWPKLIGSVAVCQLAGILGAIFTADAIPEWYDTLAKPSFVPPDWTFSVVWPILYLLMGISLYIILEKGWDLKKVKTGTGVFGIQLFLNFMWSVLFFGFRSPLMGLIEIIILWIFIVINIWLFYRISKTAGLLLIPYLLWVSFAAVLNYSIVVLNM